MKKVMVFGGALAATVLMALPALAKEGDLGFLTNQSVAVTGPGLPGGLNLTAGDAQAFGTNSGTFAGQAKSGRPPLGALGPRYDVLYTFRCEASPGHTQGYEVHESLYPYAAAGAWTFTPAGQMSCPGYQVPAGWFAAKPALFTALVATGLPSAAPAANPAALASPPLTDAPHSTWIIGLIVVFVGLVVGAALVARARSSRSVIGG